MSALLTAKKREGFRQSGLTQLRENGNFPAVIYGKDVDSQSVYVNEGDFFKVMKEVGRNGVISLKTDNGSHHVILQDYQQDPIKNQIIHADFLAVDLNSDMTAAVRVDVEGEAIGTKAGGVLQQPLFELTVTAPVNSFPENIVLDVSNLEIGAVITVGDIRKKYSFEIQHADDETLVSILAPRLVEEDSSTDTEAATNDTEA